jgi:SWI/SNF-related matrix-associated actin-dependent regulator of chromatin subfamily A member 5
VLVGTLLIHFLFWHMLATNKVELMEMITVGAEKIINTDEECVPPFAIHLTTPDLCNGSFTINDDIDAIIQRGEERTLELNSK